MTPTRETIAERLANYADAAAAFSAVNSLAFVVTLTQPEVRCTLANVKWITVSGTTLQSLGIALVVVMLRRAEIHVRANSSPMTPDVEWFLRAFFLARLAVIGIFGLLTAACLVVFALGDPGCASPGGFE